MVIHHTPNAKESFKHLVKHTKKGGIFSTYTYKIKGPIREFCDNFIREKTTQMDYKECYEFSKAITLLGKSFSELNQNVEIPEDIPLLNIKKEHMIYKDSYIGISSSVSGMKNMEWKHQ